MVSIALPVYNGADTLTPVVESVLAQTYSNVELVISDNASTDGTQEICRRFEREDRRVVYHRQATNVGLLNNFISAAENAAGTYLRWIGDDDWLEPEFVARVLAAFREDPHRVLVTTVERSRPRRRGARDARRRLRLLDRGVAGPRPAARGGAADAHERRAGDRSPLRDDPPRPGDHPEEEHDARGPGLRRPARPRRPVGGPAAAPLAGRRRTDDSPAKIARLLGVPEWQRHVRVLLQCRELDHWIAQSPLDAAQRRRARAEVLRFYARGKRNAVRRRIADVERLTGRSLRVASEGAR